MSELCTCGSQRSFVACCGPYLAGEALAPTAEALMRSRYSAFCTGNGDYLLATQHPSTRLTGQEAEEHDRLSRSVNSTQWINLLIIKTQKGQKKDKTGRVEFVAAYQAKPLLAIDIATSPDTTAQSPSAISQLHENSRFVREQGQWFYLDGHMLPPYQPKRSSSGRNSLSQPCWCGSGKPYKYCHFQ